MKMGSGGIRNRGKSWSGGVLWALGGLVDDSVGIFGEAWQQDGAKWTKFWPSWQQVVPKSRQDAAKMASLVNFEFLLGRFVDYFGRFLVSFLRVGGK